MGGSTFRVLVLVGVCALLLGFCSGIAAAAPPSRAGAGRGDDIVVFPQNWRETYPFFARFADTEGAEHVVDLAAARFSTDRLVTLAGRRTFREPDLSTFPVTNVRQPFSLGRRDLFIVQAADARAQVALRRWLEQARTPILGYVPDHAYLVKLDQRALSLASAQPQVFWIGLFQPAYRVAPELDFIQDADPGHLLKLRLLLDPEDYPSEGDVRAMVGTVPEASVVDVTRSSRDWIVRVEGPVTLARTFAARPGCLWVERFVEFQLDNNVARSSGLMANGRGILPGPIMDVDNVWARGLHGEGQIASAADTGLSTGDITTPDSLHWDFGQVGSLTNPMRVLKGYALGRSGTWDDDQTAGGGHGTHTSGSIVGNGIRSGSIPRLDSFPTDSFAGIAPKAQFVFQSVLDSTKGLGGLPGDLRTLFQQTYNDGARVHSNSWGAAVNGAYDTNAQAVDDFAWANKDMVITFSAGNSGVDLSPSDGVIDTDSIGSPGTAKNCITVGASENARSDFMYEFSPGVCVAASYTWGWFDGASYGTAPVSSDLMANNASGMAAFSSRGPTDDSRFKPDVTAPGVAIISTRTNKNQAYEQWGICNVPAAQRPYYLAMGGTSMANPLTAGAATLVRQYYADGWHPNGSDVTYSTGVPVQGFNPSSALVKATLVNGAYDMAPGQYAAPSPQEIPPGWDTAASRDLPNNAEGYGRVDLEASLFPGAGWDRNAARSMHVRDIASGLGTGGRNSYTYNVLSNADPLIATLAWTDPSAATGAGTKLVNNLDLEVTSPTGRRYTTNRANTYVTPPTPFVRDSLNNVEQVKVTAPETGTWTVDVVGTSIPGNGGPGTTSQPYALVLSAVTCVMPAVPSPVTAVPNGNSRVDVSWGAVAGATEYRVYRRYGTEQKVSLVATVAAPGTTFADTSVVPGNYSYFYVVRAASGGCESASLSEVSAFPTGVCGVGPDFAGLASVSNPASATCGLSLAWTPATARCGGPVSYSIYRSTSSGFAPGLANRIAAGLATTTYADSSALASGTTYYYVVRATDDRIGVQETNAVQRSGRPTGPAGSQPVYPLQDFDSLADGSYASWTLAAFSGGTTDWRGVRTCTAHSGGKVFRFGGTTCTAGYGASTHSFARPGGGIPVPAGATNVRLSFWHRWSFETSHDAGYLRIAFGSTYYYVPNRLILSGGYSTGTNMYLGVPVWHGDQPTFVNTVVDLDGACRLIDAAGCAGKTVIVAFTTYADSADVGGPYAGWFIDDVQVTADVPGSCSAAPLPVRSFSARSTSGTNLLEWQNPAAGAYGSAVVRYRTDGTFPASAVDGTGVTCPGQDTGPGAYNSCSHAVANGTSCSYSLFVDNGSGVYSPRRTVAATPFDTAGPRKWAYSTGAANLAPTGILPGAIGTGGVYAFSNDRSLHAMNPTAAGGSWPRTGPFSWSPATMNAPAQHRPPVVPLAAGARVFLASQDGYAYAVDADSGAPVWTSAKLGDVLQANPAGLFSDLVPGAPNLLFVGTRNATSANTLYGLDPATGATVTQFDNGGGGSAIGIITGIAVDYATSYVYFTSRASGSPDTVWCLNATGGTLSKVWSYAAGDIDGSPVLYQGRIYVGTNSGRVKAVDPATGVEAWTFNAGADYPVKGHVFPHVGSSPPRLYFSGTSMSWAIQDNGTSASLLWSVFNTTDPSTPLHVAGTNHLLVGGSSGYLCELSTTNGALEGCLNLGTGALGSPARDSVNGLIHVGSTGGVLHAVTLPVP